MCFPKVIESFHSIQLTLTGLLLVYPAGYVGCKLDVSNVPNSKSLIPTLLFTNVLKILFLNRIVYPIYVILEMHLNYRL